ncbi:MAG: bifunctional DNA-formamidopyrimidine glycosylase/DNA-(apurinic or apyrimidinic site) lyase [Chloroflexi bacterium]|nr:bifunctional DNA-formamidopyrimidine glycosylase/DNA-(apurinic or apyrimidinic site) lyase [Chloroflexota bacterium]
MPELPEVETVARDLARLVAGATITGARGDWPPAIASHDSVEGFAAAVAGRRVESVGRRAKLVVVRLEGGAALTVHLRMTGQLFVVPAGAPADRHVHVVLPLADGREIRFRDVRKLGRIGCWPVDPGTGDVLERAGGAGLFAATGPEPLEDAFTLRAFRERLRGRRGRLKPLLLDQRFIAGVGNIYADEALWRARLHPLRSAATLRSPHEARLYRALRSVLAEAVERRGSSIDDYTAPDGDGSMQERLEAYQRTGEPCPRCGRPIRRIVVGGRATHFCSWCQRLPAADRRGAAAILGAARAPRTHGRRWTELAGEGTLGLTPDETARAVARARTERTRRAAATRRERARAGGGGRSRQPADGGRPGGEA